MVASGAVRKPVPSLTVRARIDLLHTMMLARATERRARALDAGEDCAEPAARRHSEPIAAGAALALGPQDRLVAPGRFRAAHLGRDPGPSTGRFSSAPDLVPIERYARRLMRGGVPRKAIEGALESAEEEAATWP